MLEIFQKTFSKDTLLSTVCGENAAVFPAYGCDIVFSRLGGASFDHGLYRVVRASDVSKWNARIATAFPEFGDRITCFGFDWLGRAFATDPNRLEGDHAGVAMFEPGTGQVLEIPCNIITFHDEELIEYRDSALASDFHDRWLLNGGAAPNYDQCIGYRKPLFLNGADELDNLWISDIDVYWHLMGQLMADTKITPLGSNANVSST